MDLKMKNDDYLSSVYNGCSRLCITDYVLSSTYYQTVGENKHNNAQQNKNKNKTVGTPSYGRLLKPKNAFNLDDLNLFF